MAKRHFNKERYFYEQGYTTEKYVIPYIAQEIKVDKNLKVLEIGCGEGGNMKPFLDLGCPTTGIDLAGGRIEKGKFFFANHPHKERLNFVVKDIYQVTNELDHDYDLILMKDVIEHIPDQEKFLGFLKQFLSERGLIFMGFPPWYNPFGGHQQICQSWLLQRLPYFHLLPKPLYKGMLKLFGEHQKKIKGLLNIYDTGITLERLERIIKKNKYKILRKTHYLINPNYHIKFGIKPKKQNKLIRSIPYFRDFFTTCGYYLITKKD
ncbi:MAG: class I SAM-dependent methyltransferase [Bacteroidota bacterium]